MGGGVTVSFSDGGQRGRYYPGLLNFLREEYPDAIGPLDVYKRQITVNALKEGWDCPFAYILASLANKTSQVDVEQILGRIVRLPHTSQHTQSALNMSYVLTSSNDFNNTVAQDVYKRQQYTKPDRRWE